MNTTSRTPNGGSGQMVSASVPRPQTQVECFLREIDAQLEMLDKAIITHGEKMAPVLRLPEPASNKAECAPPDETVCPTADKLRGFSRRIGALRTALQDLTDRCEA